jgi:hypothetical protein
VKFGEVRNIQEMLSGSAYLLVRLTKSRGESEHVIGGSRWRAGESLDNFNA